MFIHAKDKRCSKYRQKWFPMLVLVLMIITEGEGDLKETAGAIHTEGKLLKVGASFIYNLAIKVKLHGFFIIF